MKQLGRRGAALMTAMCLSVFLFALGLGFLYCLDRDGGMQIRSQRMTQATYLARSAVDYYSYKEYMATPPGSAFTPGVSSGELAVGVPGSGQFIEIIKQNPQGDCLCIGRLRNGAGGLLAERTLFVPGDPLVPGGRRDLTYDVNLDP